MTDAPAAQQRYAHEIAPEPKTGAAPLLEHARYHVARAYGLRNHDVDSAGYLQRMQEWTAQAHLALLLYGLQQKNADHAVTFSHDVLVDGEADEWLWQALTDLGIDPDSIRPYELPEVALASRAARQDH